MASSPLTRPTEGSSGSSTLKHVKWNMFSTGAIQCVKNFYPRSGPTIVTFAHVSQFVSLAECVHEIGQAGRVQMGRVIGQKCPHQLPESEIEEQRTTIGT